MDLRRSLERLATTTAKATWPAVKYYNQKFERRSVQPAWAPAPLLKRRERTFPQLELAADLGTRSARAA